jgi:hypothetical protein
MINGFSNLKESITWKTKYITRTKMSFIRQYPQKGPKGEEPIF